MTPLDERICGVASDVLNVPVGELSRDSSPETVLTWDSVAHLTLVLAVEQELGIRFDVDELDRMTTVGDLSDAAGRHLGSA
jgi:acyl carrier protein